MSKKQNKKKDVFFSPVLATSPSALCPAPHAILFFPPLPCLTCWITPPPSRLLLTLSGWYVPRTKSRDGEREEQRRRKGRGEGVCALARELFSLLPHLQSSLCCPQAKWHLTESDLLRRHSALPRTQLP